MKGLCQSLKYCVVPEVELTGELSENVSRVQVEVDIFVVFPRDILSVTWRFQNWFFLFTFERLMSRKRGRFGSSVLELECFVFALNSGVLFWLFELLANMVLIGRSGCSHSLPSRFWKATSLNLILECNFLKA